MSPDLRAMLAATACAFVSGRKVAGLYDHDAARHRRIAAESRGAHVQAYDGDTDQRFGGALPEIQGADGVATHLTVEDATARGYDRGSGDHFTVQVADGLVQLFDHGAKRWFAYTTQLA